MKAKNEAVKEREKKEKQAHKKLKEKVQSEPKVLKKKLQIEINAIARAIDYGHKCISCGKGIQTYGGHYHSVGSDSSIRYNLLNIWVQCFSCNEGKSSNKDGYNLALINIYGRERKEFVECDLKRKYQFIDFTAEMLKNAIIEARQILKEIPEEIRTPEQRWELREIYNERIGIYKNKG